MLLKLDILTKKVVSENEFSSLVITEFLSVSWRASFSEKKRGSGESAKGRE